jgi:carbamoyl-phosphate synthase large subunit
MKSTGEVMGIDRDFGLAFAKSQEAAGNNLPRSGTVFISVRDSMHRNSVFMAKLIAELGFDICATEGTWKALRRSGINAKMVHKIGEGKPDVIDLIKGDDIDFVINIPAGRKSLIDSKPIRAAAVSHGIPYITTLDAAQAAIMGMEALEKKGFGVQTIREYTGNGEKRERDSSWLLKSKKTMWG